MTLVVREDLSKRTDWRKVRLPADPALRFWIKVERVEGGCWLWRGASTSHGYGVTQWQGRVRMAHRIAYLLNYGECPDDADVMHSCDNPPCVNPAHLSLGDAKANAADMVRKGRGRAVPHRGVDNGMARLTPDLVRVIRRRIQSGEGNKAVANDLGVSPTTVGDVARGRTWRHVR